MATSNSPIDETNFAAVTPLSGARAPAGAGATQTYTVPAAARRYVAIRAVEDQGNLGRPAIVDLG